jgi:hypothetical protein
MQRWRFCLFAAALGCRSGTASDAPRPAAAASSPIPAQSSARAVEWVDFGKGEPCPEGFWALARRQNPGTDEFEKRDNETRRATLAAGLATQLFRVTFTNTNDLAGTREIELGAYDFAGARFVLTTPAHDHCLLPDGSEMSLELGREAQDKLRHDLPMAAEPARSLRATWEDASPMVELFVRATPGRSKDARGHVELVRVWAGGKLIFQTKGERPTKREVARR